MTNTAPLFVTQQMNCLSSILRPGKIFTVIMEASGISLEIHCGIYALLTEPTPSSQPTMTIMLVFVDSYHMHSLNERSKARSILSKYISTCS